MDDVLVREQFARIRSIKKLVVVGKERFDTGRMDEFQSNGTVAFVPKDAGISVAPQSARDHQVMHQVETCGIGVGSLHESVAEMGSYCRSRPRTVRRYRCKGSVPTVSERIRTQAQTAVRFNAPSSVIYGWRVASATVSAVMTLFTAASNSAEVSCRWLMPRKKENHFIKLALRQT